MAESQIESEIVPRINLETGTRTGPQTGITTGSPEAGPAASPEAGPDPEKVFVELEALFRRAEDVVANSVIGRPRNGSGYVPKIDAKIRLNREVMAWLRSMGPRHYSRINGLLMALMEAEQGKAGNR